MWLIEMMKPSTQTIGQRIIADYKRRHEIQAWEEGLANEINMAIRDNHDELITSLRKLIVQYIVDVGEGNHDSEHPLHIAGDLLAKIDDETTNVSKSNAGDVK